MLRRTMDRSRRARPAEALEPGNMGSIGAGSGFEDDDQPVRRVAPARRTDDDDAVSKRISPRVEAPPPMADNDDDVARPTRRVQTQQPEARPRLNSGDKVQDGGAGNACPPRGCTD